MRWILLSITGCTVFQGPSTDPKTNLDALWNDFDQLYGGFPIRPEVDWDASYEEATSNLASDAGPAELEAVLQELLDPLDDGHVILVTPAGLWNSYTPERDRGDFDWDTLRSEVIHDVQEDANVAWGTAAPTVGYLRLHDMADGGTYRRARAALESMQDLPALIVDVRDNPGGTDDVSAAVASCFATTTTPFLRIRLRNGPAHTDFTEPRDWSLEPDSRCAYRGDVVLLTNAFTLSAAEIFTLAMVQIPGTQHVGEHTLGAFSNVVTRDLPNGWRYGVSIGDWRDASDVSHEGIGVVPPTRVVNSVAATREGRDEAIEAAIGILIP